MPHKDTPINPELEPEGSHPCTWVNNANKHPGANMEKVWQVRHDSTIIQQEKEAQQLKKQTRQQEREKVEQRKEAASSFITEYQAQQLATIAEEEASLPCHRSQSMQYFLISC